MKAARRPRGVAVHVVIEKEKQSSKAGREREKERERERERREKRSSTITRNKSATVRQKNPPPQIRPAKELIGRMAGMQRTIGRTELSHLCANPWTNGEKGRAFVE